MHAAPAKTMGDEGHELVSNMRYKQAIQILTQYLMDCPNDANALEDLACSYRSLGDFAKALTYINLAINIAPQSASAYAERSALASMLGVNQVAKRDAIKSLDLEKNKDGDVLYWRRRYGLLLVANKKSEANKALKTAQGLMVKNDSVRSMADQIYILRNLKQSEAALAIVNAAIEKHPDIAYFLYLKTGLDFNLCNWKELEKDAENALSRMPNHPALLWASAYAKMANKKYYNAIADLDKAIYFAPSMSHSYQIRGQCYECLNDYKQAYRDYSICLSLDPKNDFAYHRRGHTLESLDNLPAATKTCSAGRLYTPRIQRYFIAWVTTIANTKCLISLLPPMIKQSSSTPRTRCIFAHAATQKCALANMKTQSPTAPSPSNSIADAHIPVTAAAFHMANSNNMI